MFEFKPKITDVDRGGNGWGYVVAEDGETRYIVWQDAQYWYFIQDPECIDGAGKFDREHFKPALVEQYGKALHVNVTYAEETFNPRRYLWSISMKIEDYQDLLEARIAASKGKLYGGW